MSSTVSVTSKKVAHLVRQALLERAVGALYEQAAAIVCLAAAQLGVERLDHDQAEHAVEYVVDVVTAGLEAVITGQKRSPAVWPNELPVAWRGAVRQTANNILSDLICAPADPRPVGGATPPTPAAPAGPIEKWQDATGRVFRVFTVQAGDVQPGVKLEHGCVVVGEEGRGRRKATVPVAGGVPSGGTLLAAKVIATPSGAPALQAAPVESAETGYALCVLRTPIGFRGDNEHTGDFDKAADVCAPWPGVNLARGRIAQGAAGGMGSGEQVITIVPAETVFRARIGGRLYGAPPAWYYVFDGTTVHAATREQRLNSLDGVWARFPAR